MGDNDDGDFDVNEEDLHIGGGGAHDEEEIVSDGEFGNDIASDEDDAEAIVDKDEDIEKKLKKKRKLQDLKQKKKLKVEQFAAAAPITSSASALASAKPQKDLQLATEDQFRLFMHNQPMTVDGGIMAALTISNFYYPSQPDGTKKGSSIPFVRAIEVGMGEGYKARLAKPSEEMGCPKVLILCSGAKRATAVINSISQKIHCKISKLFAKHFKVSDQVESLSKHHYPVAVGTPNRVIKLLELGALCLRNAELILIDTDEDAKNFSILTLPGVREDLYKLMGSWARKETTRDTFKVALVVPSST